MPGESGREDIQAFFEETLGYSGSEDIFIYGGDYSGYGGIPGMSYLFHYWNPATERGTVFGIGITVEENTYILQSVDFVWDTLPTASTFINMNPQRTIQELGEPSYLMAAVPRAGRGNMARVIVSMVYNEGISLTFFYKLNVEDNPSGDTVDFCLDQFDGQSGGRVALLQPLSNGLENLTPVQAAFVNSDIEYYELAPFEEVFAATTEEITQRIQQGEDVCLMAPLD